jgi:hypothetical protein
MGGLSPFTVPLPIGMVARTASILMTPRHKVQQFCHQAQENLPIDPTIDVQDSGNRLR